jgi:16S rRNA (cytosine967-C5)-methyltransferase
MKDEGELYALDSDEKRLSNIRPRLHRAGVKIARLHRSNDESIALLRGKADAVLVDAPCSGVGTFRRNPALKMRFDPDFPSRLSEVQRQMLDEYSGLVKVGARLVYSTCTLL